MRERAGASGGPVLAGPLRMPHAHSGAAAAAAASPPWPRTGGAAGINEAVADKGVVLPPLSSGGLAVRPRRPSSHSLDHLVPPSPHVPQLP